MSIEAMKMALATLEDIFGKNKVDVEVINALRQVIKQAEKPCKTGSQCIGGKCPECDQEEKQEPVEYPEGDVVGPCICGSWPGGKCLKCPRIAPPKREWVGLTEDEVLECFDSVALGAVEKENVIDKRVNIFNAIKAIEAKLKEKNGG